MKTFVGFGFGPIQSALFLSRRFGPATSPASSSPRSIPASSRPSATTAARYTINIARPDRIDQATDHRRRALQPRASRRPEQILAGHRRGDELATALPSVASSTRAARPAWPALLADGLSLRADAAARHHLRRREPQPRRRDPRREAVAKHCPPPPSRTSSSSTPSSARCAA